MSELGVWMDWDDPKFKEFLVQFYYNKFTIAQHIAQDYQRDDWIAATLAVFDKIATPAVYLQKEYKKWRENKRKDKTKGFKETPPRRKSEREPPTPQPDERWQPTNKNPAIEWCKEQDATEEEMKRAMDPNSKDTWYLGPRNGYQYGSIFRRVGNGK